MSAIVSAYLFLIAAAWLIVMVKYRQVGHFMHRVGFIAALGAGWLNLETSVTAVRVTVGILLFVYAIAAILLAGRWWLEQDDTKDDEPMDPRIIALVLAGALSFVCCILQFFFVVR
ncbi:MAG: hypothetical protein QY323_05430 [Patescibacteria group bacterium]|nr:MAG: hypothetical protein QY323_05430 [Patescibacteria group bacterium]